ncbi:MAG: hypothetical protein IJQ17_01085 [Oscillospiraceae bacterium]|nr:hypothetical protein [Oscillospiraceae bacterium]
MTLTHRAPPPWFDKKRKEKIALGILVVKSETESLLYAQPFLIRAGKNVYAFVADTVVLIVSLPICAILDIQAKKMLPDLAK